jgi:hypothetical protein
VNKVRIPLTVALVLIVAVVTAFAETGGTTENNKIKKQFIYEWTDAKGGVHITDDLGEVPDRYRPKARKIEMPKGQEVGPGQEQGIAESPEGGTSAETQEAASKAAWQERLRDWKERLADAKERYRDLARQRQEALEKWGGPAAVASGHLEGRVEAERLEQEMKDVQKDIDEARNMIETVIPEEARKAGIPPGWLRE